MPAADFRHLFWVLAAKGGKQIRVGGIVETFLLLCLALPEPKFICGQAVHARVWPRSASGRLCRKTIAIVVFGPHLHVGDLAGRLAVRVSLAFGLHAIH